ncbi:MAG: hypothetical protein L6R40_008807 [Gallowayella cf. fulva]|nr:MAG: hypothetical protein L6R40_008807 [Xanthomendoza cf. fulva]
MQILVSSVHPPPSRTQFIFPNSPNIQKEEKYISANTRNRPLQIYLSIISPFVSSAIFIYTSLIQLALILLSPLRLCTNRKTLRQQTIHHLAPPLRLQLRLIHSSLSSTPSSFPHQTSSSTFPPSSSSSEEEEAWSSSSNTAYSLVLTHLLSPIVSVGVSAAAWTAAAFWFYAAIIGDPDGRGGKNDGSATVLGVRGWWEVWLARPLR